MKLCGSLTVFLYGSNGVVPCNAFNRLCRLCGVVWCGGSGVWWKCGVVVLVIIVIMSGGGMVDVVMWYRILLNVILIIILYGVGYGVRLFCGYAQILRALP